MMKVAEVSGLLRWPHFRGPDLEGITLYPLPTDLSHDVCQRYHTLNAGSQIVSCPASFPSLRKGESGD